jgi:hypothetical protein
LGGFDRILHRTYKMGHEKLSLCLKKENRC